ncbi:hypothetical protein M0R45_028938 [Rubus argutus]|uniref:Endonuclease/exonuclease/phosphatase domain-containing protein n=1 Tax=Rubus argutus TaxID=59490 RepID=A0AAW1W9A0_RUBAR
MDILSWNCRGICNDTTTRALKDLISQTRPSIVFLIETKISHLRDFQALKRSLGFSQAKEVLSVGRSGGLGLFWSDEVPLRVRDSSPHFIDAEIGGGPSDPCWRLTGFYGHPRTNDRDLSWQLIRDLCDTDSLPWLLIGDFNEILNTGEKVDGPQRSERQMRGFREALGYCDLIDLGFTGSKTTWWSTQTQLVWIELLLPHVGVTSLVFPNLCTYLRVILIVFLSFYEQVRGPMSSKGCQCIVLHGQWCEDDVGLEHVVTSYFTNMFSASVVDLEAVQTTLQAIQPCVMEEMNHMLCAPYSEEELASVAATGLEYRETASADGYDGGAVWIADWAC